MRRLESTKQFTNLNLMMCIATGSSWSEERLAKAGKKGSPVCYRCGEAGITDWHTYWECPVSMVPEIACSQHLVPWTPHMRERWGETFWLRGLVQQSLTSYDINGGTEVFCLRFDDCGKPLRYAKYPTWQEAVGSNLDLDFSLEHLHAFTDGSGGKGSSDRRLRACGWAAVFMRSPFALGVAFWGELPGTVQTVPRAELAGAHFAITLAAGLGCTVLRLAVYTDCSLVSRGIAGGRLKSLQSPSLASAWAALWLTRDTASFVLEGVKVRAHMDTDPKGHVQEPRYTFGNMLADTFAGLGACYLERTAGYRSLELLDTDRDAALVMNRLVAITAMDLEANPRHKGTAKKLRGGGAAASGSVPWIYARKSRAGEDTGPEVGEDTDHEPPKMDEDLEEFAWGLIDPQLEPWQGLDEQQVGRDDEEGDSGAERWGLFSPSPEEDPPHDRAISDEIPGLCWTDQERQHWLDTWQQQCYGFAFREFSTDANMPVAGSANSAGAAAPEPACTQAGVVRAEPAELCEPARSAASSSGLLRDSAGLLISAEGQGTVAAPAPLELVVPAAGGPAPGPAPPVGTPSFYRWLFASQEPLPRGIFDSQSHWHLMVALRSLTAAGHSFVVQGTCFDLDSVKPRAPQCSLCLQFFAVKSIHATAKLGNVCRAVSCRLTVPLVCPQRLRPSREYRWATFVAESGATHVPPRSPLQAPDCPRQSWTLAASGAWKTLLVGTLLS